MPDDRLLAEANRQFSVCNACRYCEGICSVFPAMEMRTAFTSGDVSYLSTLCHDCRSCVEVCPFSEPHAFAIDIPSLMSAARSETFAEYARPAALWRLLARPRPLLAVAAITLILFLAIVSLTGGPAQLVHRHTGSGSFYSVVPFLWLVVPGAVLGVLAMTALAASAYAFASETEGGARRLLRPVAHARAVADVLRLTNLRGGGGGCPYPEDTASSYRRRAHHLVFYGFLAMFASTTSAAFEQDILGFKPPYPLVSAPVLLGTLGGLSTLSGCLAFMRLGLRQRDRRKSAKSAQLDRAFTALLLAATLTGLLTLATRTTPLMGMMLLLHLGTLGALFVVLPYSKFVHWVYRYLALVRAHAELEAPQAAGTSREPAYDVPFTPVPETGGVDG